MMQLEPKPLLPEPLLMRALQPGPRLPWALATHQQVFRPGTGKGHLHEGLSHLALLEPPANGWAPRAGDIDRFASRLVVVHAAGARPGWTDARVDTCVPVSAEAAA